MFRINHSRAEFLNLHDRNNSLKMIILFIITERDSFLLCLHFLSPRPTQAIMHRFLEAGITALTHPEADTLKCLTIVVTVHDLLWTMSSLGKYLTSQLQLFSSHQVAKATHNCLQWVIIGEDQKNDSRELHFPVSKINNTSGHGSFPKYTERLENNRSPFRLKATKNISTDWKFIKSSQQSLIDYICLFFLFFFFLNFMYKAFLPPPRHIQLLNINCFFLSFVLYFFLVHTSALILSLPRCHCQGQIFVYQGFFFFLCKETISYL